jgi:hypothetical protein
MASMRRRHQVNARCQGQCWGIRRCRRRAERTSLAGTAISVLRMVAVVAWCSPCPARVASARVRLRARAASASQAPLAGNDPAGEMGHGAVLQVRDDGLDDGVPAVFGLDGQQRFAPAGQQGVVAPDVDLELELAGGQA